MLYCLPKRYQESTQRIMRRVDALCMEGPNCGIRREEFRVIYQRPHTNVNGIPSERFPCLLKLSQVKAVDESWTAKIESNHAIDRLPLASGVRGCSQGVNRGTRRLLLEARQ